MFGKKERCAICGEKLSFTAIQINGGSICPVCNRLSTGSPLASVEQVKKAWEENHNRFRNFKPGMVISDFASGFLFIDPEQKMFYLSNSKKKQSWSLLFSSSLKSMPSRLNRLDRKPLLRQKAGLVGPLLAGPYSEQPGPSLVPQLPNRKRRKLVAFQFYMLICPSTG